MKGKIVIIIRRLDVQMIHFINGVTENFLSIWWKCL